jgi:hypothetical protein
VVKATPRPLYPREWPCVHCIGGWVGPRSGLDGCGKSLPLRFDPLTVQPLVSLCTNRTIPAHTSALYFNQNVLMFLCTNFLSHKFAVSYSPGGCQKLAQVFV